MVGEDVTDSSASEGEEEDAMMAGEKERNKSRQRRNKSSSKDRKCGGRRKTPKKGLQTRWNTTPRRTIACTRFRTSGRAYRLIS